MSLESQTITIHGKLYSKKNSKRCYKANGRTVVLSSKAYMNSLPLMHSELNRNYEKWCKILEGKSPPYRILFTIYRGSNAPFDFPNICQGIFDEMQKLGYIPDDNYNFLNPLYETVLDRKNPRTELTVLSGVTYVP